MVGILDLIAMALSLRQVLITKEIWAIGNFSCNSLTELIGSHIACFDKDFLLRLHHKARFMALWGLLSLLLCLLDGK